MNLKTKQMVSVGLSIIGAGGTIATALLVREAAKREVDDYQSLLPFIKGNIKDILNIYKLPIIIGTATVTSIIASTILNRRAEASLMSMALIADQGWRKYKYQVKNTLGLDKHEDILKGIAKKTRGDIDTSKIDTTDNRELYFDEIIGFFQAVPEDLAYAYAEINEMINTAHSNWPNDVFEGITLGTFLRLAHANLINESINNEILESWGWTIEYLADVYKSCWIHMGFSNEVTDDGVVPYRVISWIQDPILMNEQNYEEALDLTFDEPNIEYADLKMFDLKEEKPAKKGTKQHENKPIKNN